MLKCNFSVGKDEKYAAKQAKRFDTLHLTYVVSGFRCECFVPNPSSSFHEKWKKVENEEKNIDDLQTKLKLM